MVRSLSAGVVLGALAACSPATTSRSVRAAPRPPAPTISQEETVVSLVERDTPNLTVAPGTAGEGGRRYFVSGRPAEVEGERVTFGPDALLGEVRCAAEVEGGWVFVTESGLVAASDSFVGPLRRLGQVTRPLDCEGHTLGRLVVQSHDGAWLASARSLTPVRGTPSPMTLGAFSDPERGLGMLEDGRLVRTRDGGATWTAVDLGMELALEVFLHEGVLHVQTTGERVTLGDGDVPRPVIASSSQPPSQEGDPDALSRVLRAWRARSDAGSRGDALRLADGTLLSVNNGALVHQTSHGTTLSRRPARIYQGERCTLRRWGPAVGVLCGDVLRTVDGVRFEPVQLRAIETRSLVFSDDGVHAAVGGACDHDEHQRGRDGDQVCALLDGTTTWRELNVEGLTDRSDTRWSVVGMHGDLLLVRSEQEDGWRYRVVRVTTGESSAPTFTPPDERSWRAGDWYFTADGLLAGTVHTGPREAPESAGVLGAHQQPLPPRSLPARTQVARFLDGSRGIAVGANLDELWRTLDGGASWETLAIPIDGAEGHPGAHRRELVCEGDRCVVDGLLRVEGWGPARAGDPAALIARLGPEPAPPTRPPNAPTFAGIECLPRGRAVASPWRGRPAEPPLTLGLGTRDQLRGGPAITVSEALLPENRRGGGEEALEVTQRGANLLMVAEGETLGRHTSTVFEVTPTGAVATRRVFLRTRGDLTGLAEDHGRWGLIRLTEQGALTLHPLHAPPGQTESLPSWAGALAPCASPPPRGAISAWMSCPSGLLSNEHGGETFFCRVELTLAPGGSCLRGAQFGGYLYVIGEPEQHEELRSWLSIHAERGRLVGFYDDLMRRTPVRCEVFE